MVDIIFFFSEISILVAYLYRDILKLRLFTMIGCLGYISGALMAGHESPGMKVLIGFSVAALIVNSIQLYYLFQERKSVRIPPNLKDIYTNTFSVFTKNEFLKFMTFSKKFNKKMGDILVTEGEKVSEVMLINKGLVSVFKKMKHITDLPEGFFVGEMSFLTEESANATVIVSGEYFEGFAWSKVELAQMDSNNPDLYAKFKQAIGINLIRKIDRSSDPDT